MKVDLHTHSHFSDGTLSPADVVRRAFESGMRLMVLTDHDCVAGYEQARAQGEQLGMKVLCGVEINTQKDDIHVLGYGIEWLSPAFIGRLAEFRGRREKRIRAIVERLRQASIDISWEEVQNAAALDRGQAVGRPHVADALRRKKIVRSRREAFQKFLSHGKSAFVDPMGPTAEEAIAAIREAGGTPVIAHPGSLFDLDRFRSWADVGLGGIEIYYPTHTHTAVLELLQIARMLNLMPTGGSDFHGPGTGRDKLTGFDPDDELWSRLAPALERGRA